MISIFIDVIAHENNFNQCLQEYYCVNILPSLFRISLSRSWIKIVNYTTESLVYPVILFNLSIFDDTCCWLDKTYVISDFGKLQGNDSERYQENDKIFFV